MNQLQQVWSFLRDQLVHSAVITVFNFRIVNNILQQNIGKTQDKNAAIKAVALLWTLHFDVIRRTVTAEQIFRQAFDELLDLSLTGNVGRVEMEERFLRFGKHQQGPVRAPGLVSALRVVQREEDEFLFLRLEGIEKNWVRDVEAELHELRHLGADKQHALAAITVFDFLHVQVLEIKAYDVVVDPTRTF